MLFRPTVEADLDRLLACVVDEHISWSHPDRLLTYLESREYRHDRMWIAEENGEILARAVWWGFAGGDRPEALDCLYVHPSIGDRVGLAAELLSRAHAAFGVSPAYHVFLGSDWRADPVAAAAVAWRKEAVGRAGLTDELERLRYEWTADAAPLPTASERLVFHGDDDDETFVQAFARVAVGTLDHHTRQALTTMDPLAQAREDVADYRSMPGDRSWWRLARTRDGDLVGVALPSANSGGPVVGYLGVVPEHRGRGYVDDLLAEITRCHAERGAQRVVADTDAGNVPMARAFERAGYRRFAIRLVLSEPAPDAT